MTSPFKKPTAMHVFINVDRKNPLNEDESNDLAKLVEKFIKQKIREKTGDGGAGDVWVRMPPP